MKKLFFTMLTFASVIVAGAQPRSILLYGNVSVSSDNQDYGYQTVQNNQWGINPGIGYQLDNHWTIGVQGGFGQGNMPNTAVNINQTVKTNDWAAGVFVRYGYDLGHVFYMYSQLDLNSIGGTWEVENVTSQANYIGFRGSYYPAIGARIAKGWAVNLNIGGISYRAASWTDNPTGLKNDNKFNLDFGQVLSIGISKNFACHCHMHGHHEPGEEMRHIDTSDDDDAPKAAPAHKHRKDKKDKKEKKHQDDDDD